MSRTSTNFLIPGICVELLVSSELGFSTRSFGLGWGWFNSPFGKAVFKEGGRSGFKHYSVLFPDAEKGILIMTNSFNADSIFKELLEVPIKDTFTP